MELLHEKNLVFTYGTLKRGFPNYSIIESTNPSFIATAKTRHKFPLLQAGKWNVPFLIHEVNYPDSYQIEGELFEVDKQGILVLDEFEGVDRAYYKRLPIEVYHKDKNGKEVLKKAWCYFRYDNYTHLLKDPSKFLPFFGKEALQKYVPVHQRPSDWREDL